MEHMGNAITPPLKLFDLQRLKSEAIHLLQAVAKPKSPIRKPLSNPSLL